MEPWERQPNETSRAFAAFVVYRELGRSRSLAKVRQQYGDLAGGNLRLLERWSGRWRWSERAAAWDLRVDTQLWQANEREAKEMGARHARAALSMQARALQRLQSLDVAQMDARDLTYM